MFQAKAKRRQRSDSKALRSRSGRERFNSRSLCLETLEPRMMLTATPGTWTALTSAPPSTFGSAVLLSDGTVIGHHPNGSTTDWSKLTPDSTGSYVNGTWSQIASESVGRMYNATNVLQDGRVFVLGGEYNNPFGPAQIWSNTGDIYNPVTNIWTNIPNFPEPTFGGPTMLLPDGRVLAGSMNGPQTYIYDPATNAWSNGPTKLYNDLSVLETWTKLADGSILSYDLNDGSTEAERLNTSTMTWGDAGTVPVALQAATTIGPTIGPAVLLPDGQVFQVGGDSNTALYDPATNTWAAGPVIPGGLGGNEAAAAMMPNGHVLFDASATPNFGSPTRIFEFDPADNSVTDVTPTTPDFSSGASYVTRMLMLPSGQVLFLRGYVYTPSGAPQAAWQPTISTVAANSDGTFTLTGTQLNGLSAGASYCSSAEMDSNYPIVEMNNGAGHVYFARTFNWSSTGVATGSTPVSTEFSLPPGLPYGTYSLTVVANGIASAPVSFTGGYTNEADLAVIDLVPARDIEGLYSWDSISVTNYGPTTATKVVLTDTLGANSQYLGANTPQGTFKQSGNVVTFSLGTIAVGQTVTVQVAALYTEDGNVTNSAAVTSNVADANLNNNSAVAITAVSEPAIVVSAPITTTSTRLKNVAVATFTHGGIAGDPASAFVATINWGDGSTSTGSISLSGQTYTVTGSHTYSQGGSHTITTTVVEAGSSQNSAAMSISTGSVQTASATTSTSAGGSAATNGSSSPAKRPRDAVFAGDLSGLYTGKADGGGAEMMPDTDKLDLLFEKLAF
jgi:Domain of unknown function DUF11/Kelch motif